MTIACLNVNSLLLHIDEIRVLLKDLGIHILALNETKLDENISDELISIKEYTIKRKDRNRHGGGVAFYIKDSISDKISVREDFPESSLELLCLELKPVQAAPFFIMTWYRPPDERIESFNKMEQILQFLDREDKEIILLGDTNCDILSQYSNESSVSSSDLPSHSSRILEMYDLFRFEQLIREGTRVTLSSKRCLTMSLLLRNLTLLCQVWLRPVSVTITWLTVLGGLEVRRKSNTRIFGLDR